MTGLHSPDHDLTNRVLFRARGTALPSPKTPDRVWDPSSSLSRSRKHRSSHLPKVPLREGDHSPLHSANVKNVWSYTSTSPYSYLVLCVIKYMNHLVFIRICCVMRVQKWDINMFGNLVTEIAGSFETSLFLSDYTTSQPRSQ